MTQRKILLLIDTSALIYRSYHALPPLTTRDGEMVNAVYGVASTILSVAKEYEPTYMIAAYDVGKATFRHKAYKAYKAKRAAMPDDLRAQLRRVRALMDAFGIVGVEHKDFEADDIIGTIAHDVVKAHDDVDVVIVTGDNDALQLVTDRISVRTFGRGLSDAKVYDPAAVEAKYGIAPALLADYKGLAGDSSDNIPGVGGVGAKTATTLLQRYGSLEAIYAHLDELKGAVKARLERDRAQAFLSRDLGRIVTDVPIVYDVERARVQLHTEAVRAFFRAMNFFSLLKRLPDADASVVEEPVRDEKYVQVATEDVRDVLVALAQEEMVAVAIATSDAAVRGVALCAHAGRVQFVSWTTETVSALRQFFARSDRRAVITTFDLKALMHALRKNAIEVVPPYSDSMLQAYVLGAGTILSLEHCAQDVLGETSEVPQGEQLALLPDDAVMVRAAQRKVDVLYKLAQKYQEDIATLARTQRSEASIATILARIEIPLIRILADMEEVGVPLNVVALQALREDLVQKIAHQKAAIYKHVGAAFNINSPQQLARILFDVLQLPTDAIKKTKTGYSTAASELAKLHDTHPIIASIEEYRELYKLKSTYVDALPKLVVDGRVHTTFQQAVTATGRLSSTDPNLQNIPTRTAYAQQIRTAFAAPDGFVLLSADYSQIDLRCVAHIAQDAKMIAAFARGDDIHETTAMEVFGVTKSKVTKAMRRQAKALNFGLIYGMGAYGFAQSAGIAMDEARTFIDRYFTRFSGVAHYMEETIAQAKQDGFVQTPFGRRRAVPEINAANQQLARSGERIAINMPVQGMAADIIKMAMIAVDAQLRAQYTTDDVRMILQVHDEIICEVRTELVDAIADIVKTAMESVVTLRVPLVVDTVSGATWANLK